MAKASTLSPHSTSACLPGAPCGPVNEISRFQLLIGGLVKAFSFQGMILSSPAPWRTGIVSEHEVGWQTLAMGSGIP